MRRKRDATSAARARWRKAAAGRRRRVDPNIKREYLSERRFRFQSSRPADTSELPIVSSGELHRPRLLWLDPHGRLHVEPELSAEELIRQLHEKEAPALAGAQEKESKP
jgi:hypothetical protein